MDKWRIKKDVFVERMGATRNTYKSLSGAAEISQGSITNAQQAGCSLKIVEAIGQALRMGDKWRLLLIDEDRQRLEEIVPEGVYAVNWDDLESSAEALGKKLFDELKINTILSFPGPSLIFAGLIMAKALCPKQIARLALYTAMFSDPAVPDRNFPQFDPIRTERFTIFIPKALMLNHEGRDKRIAVIDDSIITGKTMDAIRSYFIGMRRPPDIVKFACCICHQSRTFLEETTPICELTRPEGTFRMPWGNAFAFESAFPPNGRRLK